MKILLTADWHLREDMPICRKDVDWISSQRKDLEIIQDIVVDNKVDQVWILGDIFHTPTVPAYIVNLAIDGINQIKQSCANVRIMAGNHDLPYHNAQNVDKCSFGILKRQFDSIDGATILPNTLGGPAKAFDFGTETDDESSTICIHRLVLPSSEKELAEISNSECTEDIAKAFPSASRIFMGDYHNGYVEEVNGKTFVMPGCLNIQSGGLANYKPMVVIWDTQEDTYTKVAINNNLAIISTEHLVEAKERDSRLEACISIAGSSLSKEFDFPGELKNIADKLDVIDLYNEMTTDLNIGAT